MCDVLRRLVCVQDWRSCACDRERRVLNISRESRRDGTHRAPRQSGHGPARPCRLGSERNAIAPNSGLNCSSDAAGSIRIRSSGIAIDETPRYTRDLHLLQNEAIRHRPDFSQAHGDTHTADQGPRTRLARTCALSTRRHSSARSDVLPLNRQHAAFAAVDESGFIAAAKRDPERQTGMSRTEHRVSCRSRRGCWRSSVRQREQQGAHASTAD
jgi:hypothetical protein